MWIEDRSKLLLSAALFLVLIPGCVRHVPGTATVTVGGQTVMVRVAETEAQKAQGLAGTPQLAWNEGMLFPFSQKQELEFWMKGMLIPIDIIWIADKHIVGIEHNVPLPSAGAPDEQLPRYRSPAPADMVLEVRAGFASKYDLKTGDPVSVDRK